MSTSQTPVLSARGIVKNYGRVTALDHADFDLYPGEILAVIGDNGAGKSSLIKAISGAVSIDEGEIRLNGEPVRFTSPMQARVRELEGQPYNAEDYMQPADVAEMIARALEVPPRASVHELNIR